MARTLPEWLIANPKFRDQEQAFADWHEELGWSRDPALDIRRAAFFAGYKAGSAATDETLTLTIKEA